MPHRPAGIALLLFVFHVVGAHPGFGPSSNIQARARPITVDDLMSLSTINDVEIAPAGDRVAYTVSTPDVGTNTHGTALFVLPVGGGTPARLAPDARIFVPALPAPRLRWSPDGLRISFLATEESRPQVFAVSPDGGPAHVLTSAPEGVTGYEWSPDGTRLAFLTRDTAPAPPVANLAGSLPPATRLWIQDVGSPASARALTPASRFVDSFAWKPTGEEIAFSSSPTSGFMAPYSTRIDAITADGHTTRSIVDRAGMNVQPQYSPDGRHLSFISTGGRAELLAPRGLAVVPAGGGDPSQIRSYPMNGAWISEIAWAADSQSLLVTMNEGTFATGAQMFEMPVVRVTLESGRAERLSPAATVDYNLSLSRDGRSLAYRSVEARTMGELVVLDVASGTRRTLTTVNPALAGFALGRLEPISWRSFDGMEIWGLLLAPPGYDGARRLPLLVYCHGGPVGGVTLGLFPQFMHVPGQIDPYPTEAFASAGYAVLFPMPRGGSGYGEAGHRMIINDWGGPDYKDIMAGVDHLIARGVADADRLGVMGASYGGFMTNWIVTQTSRFKAASAGASIADLSDLYYLTEAGEVMAEYFKRPWENPDGYRDRSPLTHVTKVTTPLLIQHGDRDPRVPLATAQKFHRALAALGKTVELHVYPRGGHVFYEPVQERAVMQRNFEWFEKWMAAAAPTAVTAQPPDPRRFEKEVQAFEAEDRATPPPPGSVLFVGSSSIRYWDLEAAFPGRRAIKRGFGGSHVSDNLFYADRIIIPYRPPLIVFYAGDADVAAGKTAEQIGADYRALVAHIHERLPAARIVIIGTKPSPAHWAHMDTIRAANAAARSLAAADPLVEYTDAETALLGMDGRPQADLFAENGLNLNARGYDAWTRALRPAIEPFWPAR